MEEETPEVESSQPVPSAENTLPIEKKNIYVGFAVLAVVVIGAIIFLRGGQKTQAPTSEVSSPTPVPKSLSIPLSELGKSGEAGTATITQSADKVVVSLNLIGAPKGVVQPAHIHKGGCPGVGVVVYPLNFPVEGQSETTLDVSFDNLMAQLPLAVNIHKSESEAKVYVSCGEITP